MQGKKVFVGLSGGVDSAVAAALLKEQGALVTGVFIKGWYPPGLPCTWAADRRDAMRVAAHLKIPFRTLDAAREYKESVLDYLIQEYKEGRTPNPDVMCNRDIKFGAFYRYAMQEGADYIATGHYVTGEKDQRYFLWAVPKEAFAKTLFPLAHHTKPQVRTLAKKYGLPVALKPDSQGVCFLGPVSVEDFLIGELGRHPGGVVNEKGERVGEHQGAALYTLGERTAIDGGPWYVVAKDMGANTVMVARTPARPLQGSAIHFSHANWLIEPEGEVSAQYRYRGPLVRGLIAGGSFTAHEGLGESPAAGQSLVFYKKGQLIGGGVIT